MNEVISHKFLMRCRSVTTHYKNKEGVWKPKDQILKMYEEVAEVQKAKQPRELLEETCDVILASITMFDILGVPYDRFQEIMEATLQKVESRITDKELGSEGTK